MPRLDPAETRHCFVKNQEVDVPWLLRRIRIFKRDLDLTAPAFRGLPPAQMVDQNVAHQLGGQGVELGAALKGELVLAHEPQPYLMHERRRLQDRLAVCAAQSGTPETS